MHILFQSLIQGAVGFAIGAGTNELAIRWVFWAIFAKKKKEIAAAVQRVVSRELMTPEKIACRLESPQVAEALRASILKALESAAADELPALDTLAGRLNAGPNLEDLQRHLAAMAADAVAAHIAAPAFRDDTLRTLLDEQWRRLAPRRPADILPDCTRSLLSTLPASLAAAVLAPEHREQLCLVIANGLRSWMNDYPTPASFLGPANCVELARMASSRTRLLGEELARLLASAPAQTALCAALRSAVRKRLDGQGAIGSLLNGLSGAALVENQLAKFCETVPDAVREQFGQDGDETRMRGLVETAARSILERPWGDLLDTADPETIGKHVRAVLASDAVRDMARHGFESVAASVIGSLQNASVSEASRLIAGGGDVAPYLDWLAETLHAALCSREVRSQIEQQTDQILRRLRTLPIGSPDRFLPDGAKPRLAAFLTDQVTTFARSNIADLSEKTHIWDIISESITVYDEKRMEQITRSVANRELLWVTLLGGIIGFVVGVAQSVVLFLIDRIS